MLYPILDAVLIALCVRVWASRRGGSAGIVLIAAGALCWFMPTSATSCMGDDPGELGRSVASGWLVAGACYALGIWQRPRRSGSP